MESSASFEARSAPPLYPTKAALNPRVHVGHVLSREIIRLKLNQLLFLFAKPGHFLSKVRNQCVLRGLC